MANVEFSFGGGKPGMPNLAGLKSRFLTIVAVVAVFILLMAATTSIPTGHVGVLTLFGRVTGDVLPEGIHLINPLKSVEKMTVQTQSRKESASVPSKEGLTLSLDTSLLFRLDRDKAAQVLRTIGVDYAERSWSRSCGRRFAERRLRIPPMICIRTGANWFSNRLKMT